MTGTAIQVAFPKTEGGASTALALPAPQNLPVATGLGQAAATPEGQHTLSCKDLLMGDTREQAEREAAKLYVDMLANTQVFMTYGTGALEGVNDLIDRILNEIEDVNIPELREMMKSLNDEMRSIKRGYDVADPKVREKFENWSKGIRGFFRKAKDMVEMLMEDVKSVEDQLDKVVDQLLERQKVLIRNVAYYDELYAENEQEILKVIYAIGVMELVRDLAVADAGAIQVGDASLGDRGGEQKASLIEFATNMEAKIAEYKGRLFVAWSTSPQTRTMRTLNVGLAMRINELVHVTIPTMKATIAQWKLLMQTKQAADLAAVVQEASNEWLVSYAEAGAEVVPMVAELVQTPTLQPQTVFAMADSIERQTDGVLAAIDLGVERRAELDRAIIEAKGLIDTATDRLADGTVERFVAQVQQRELEVATSVGLPPAA